jgi:hypothetical protein
MGGGLMKRYQFVVLTNEPERVYWTEAETGRPVCRILKADLVQAVKAF